MRGGLDDHELISLPEPPALRERLRTEIEFFIKALKDKAERDGSDPEKAVDHSSHVIEYVLTARGE